MPTKFESYQKAKKELAESRAWLEMIGKPQPRTTAHADGYLSKLSISAQVHFQHSDGAKNYHDAPDVFEFILQEVVRSHFQTLTDEAIKRMAARADEMRKEAAEEYRQLLESDETKEAT